MLGPEKFLAGHMIQQIDNRLPVTVDIGENYGLVEATELLPSHYLKGLFKCSYTARQYDEGIRVCRHRGFAFMHVVGNDDFGGAVVGDFHLV